LICLVFIWIVFFSKFYNIFRHASLQYIEQMDK